MSAHVPRGPEDEVTPCEPWREDDSEDETDDGLPKWVEGDSLAPHRPASTFDRSWGVATPSPRPRLAKYPRTDDGLVAPAASPRPVSTEYPRSACGVAATPFPKRYVGTPPEVLDEAFKLADLTREDIVLDVGSGDGRIPTWAAARWGATRAYGLELEAPLVARATDEARRRGVADRTTFYECDVTKPFSKAADAAFEEATLITMYLLPEALDRVRPLIVRHLSGPMLPLAPASVFRCLRAATDVEHKKLEY